MAVVEVQFWVGTPDANKYGDGHIVHAMPLGSHFTKAEILDYWQNATVPAGWSALDEDEQDEKRYEMDRTKELTENTVAFIAEEHWGTDYTSANPAQQAKMESIAQGWKTGAQYHRDVWTGSGPGEGIGIDTNWGDGDLSDQFGIVLVDVPSSSRYIREFKDGSRPVDHGVTPLKVKAYIRRSRYRMPYEALPASWDAKVADWKTVGVLVPVDRGQTPFTVAQIKGAIP